MEEETMSESKTVSVPFGNVVDQVAGYLETRKLHYPGDCSDIAGQVVGPNWLREFYRISAASYDPATDTTTAELTDARKLPAGSAGSTVKQQFVLQANSIMEDEKRRGFRPAPDWIGIRKAQEFAHKPHLWFIGQTSEDPARPGVGSSMVPASLDPARARVELPKRYPSTAEPDRKKQVRIANRGLKERRR